MNRGEQALKIAKIWSAKVGPEKVKLYLVNHDVAFSTADKVARGRYESTPGYDLADAILDGAALDGITPARVKTA